MSRRCLQLETKKLAAYQALFIDLSSCILLAVKRQFGICNLKLVEFLPFVHFYKTSLQQKKKKKKKGFLSVFTYLDTLFY